MSEKVQGRLTEFGFIYGAAEVSRSMEHKGHVFIRVKTGREYLDLRITPGGRIKPHDGQSGMTPTHIFPIRHKREAKP